MKSVFLIFALIPLISVAQESNMFGVLYQGIVLDEVQYDYYSKGLKYLDEGNVEESIGYFNKLYDAGVANDYVNLLRAEIYYELNDFRNVVYVASMVLNDPDIDLMSTINGTYRYRDSSGRISTTNLLGGPPIFMSNFLVIRGYAKYFLHDYLGAKSDSEKHLALWSNSSENLLLRGMIEYELKNYEIAISFLKLALRSNEKSSNRITADAYYYLGFCYLGLGNKNDALKNFSKAGEYGKSHAYEVIKRINSRI